MSRHASSAHYHPAHRWIEAKRPVRVLGDRLYTEVPESYFNVGAKMLAAFRHVFATEDFDYLYRTNTSSYVNRRLLSDYASLLPRERFYGGYLGEVDGIPFASGTGALLSRDLVRAAIEDRVWDYDAIDDVALGRCMRRAGASARLIPRIDGSSQLRV